MYEYTPRPRRTGESIIELLLCALGCALCAAATLFGGFYRSALLAFGVLCLSCFCILIARYRLTSFSYCVEAGEGGERDLTVRMKRGRRLCTVCRISTHQILEVRPAGALGKNARRAVSYDYTAAMRYCPEHYLLTVQDGDATVGVLILADGRLLELLKSL